MLSLSQHCAYHTSNTIVLLQWHIDVVRDALTVGQGYRLSAIVGGLLFHVHLWISFIHCSIESRFYHPCCRTGYVGFSVQACFLNSVSAVLSLNSLCQFILCNNNLLPQEVISFGVFYRLFCCLDHASKAFLWLFAASFSDCSQHSASLCDLAMASTNVSLSRFLWLYWGDSLWDLSLGPLDGHRGGPSCSRPSLIGHESL